MPLTFGLSAMFLEKRSPDEKDGLVRKVMAEQYHNWNCG
jgi:hypothetical protein